MAKFKTNSKGSDLFFSDFEFPISDFFFKGTP